MKNLVLSCVESRVESNHILYGRFLLAPFQKGSALTVGTALRRALLSQIETVAITALDIQGTAHEFSTIVGVRESVLELSLNFQRVVLRDYTKEERIQVGYLQVQGPTVVYANDLKLPNGVECVDPTQYIATLSRDGLLVVKFLIERSSKKSHLKKNNHLVTGTHIQKAKQVLKETKLQQVVMNPFLRRSTRKESLSASSHALRASRTSGQAPLPCTGSHDRVGLQNDDLSEINILRNEAPTGVSRNVQNHRTRTQLDFTSNTSSQANVEWDQNRGLIGTKIQEEIGKKEPSEAVGFSRNDKSINLLSNKCLQNVIPLDVFLTPVNKANFVIQVDDLSVGARERLVFEVWTNGSIHPRQALHSAALSLISLFSELRNLIHLDSHFLERKNSLQSELQMNLSKRLSLLYKSNLDKKSLLSSDLSNLSLSLKTYVFFKQKGIHQLDSLLNHSSKSLLQFVNGNQTMFYEVKRCLFALGLQLREEPEQTASSPF